MDNENSNDQGGNPSSVEAHVMPTHTPGPWHYQEDSDAYTHIVRGPTGKIIASTAQNSSGEAEANARLIAAAPNLLSAAKRMLEAVRSKDPAEPGTQRPDGGAVMSLKGAIAKAEGEV